MCTYFHVLNFFNIFNFQVLCTDKFVACLSDQARKYMRHIDKVSVKGSASSLGMYTFDTFQDQTVPEVVTDIDVNTSSSLT
jgi:hypothetical protein